MQKLNEAREELNNLLDELKYVWRSLRAKPVMLESNVLANTGEGVVLLREGQEVWTRIPND